MEKINELSLGEKLILGAGVLLFIDLFLHWQSYDLGPITLGRSGIHGFWGIFLFGGYWLAQNARAAKRGDCRAVSVRA